MPRPMRIQPRDTACLAELGECGVMDKNMIHSRHYHTQCDRVARRRLAQLESNGLIQRLRISEFHAHQRPGRLPSVFVLTDKGADIVYRFTGRRPRPVRPLREQRSMPSQKRQPLQETHRYLPGPLV